MIYELKIWQLLLAAVAVFSFIAIVASLKSSEAMADQSRINCDIAGDRAQALFDSNPKKFKSLDRDKDGLACENN